MSKIIITADLHLGLRGRLKDTMWACRVIKEFCVHNTIDTVVVLGDMFHDRRSIDIETLSAVAEFFEDAVDRCNQQWITFPGNHDMFLRHSWNINSIKILKKYMTVIETVEILQLDDVRFWVIPFISLESAYMKVLGRVKGRIKDDEYILTHIGSTGATLNTCFLLSSWSKVHFNRIKCSGIYAGHFHNKQELPNNLRYPGSLIPFKFDEGDMEHGFYVHDLESGECEFVDIWKAGAQLLPDERPAPQFHTLLDDLLSSKTTDEIDGNVIRVALQREYSTEERRDIKKMLLGMGALSVRWMNLYHKDVDEMKSEKPVPTDVFRSWYKSDNSKIAKELDENTLMMLHSNIVAEADEIYSMENYDV